MKHLIVFSLLVWSFARLTLATDDYVRATFRVVAPTLPDTAAVYIAGNHEALGNWDPGAVRLENLGDKTWGSSFQIPRGTTLAYKFTKGTWETEAVGDYGAIPPNTILEAVKDTTVKTVIRNWKDQFEYEIEGQITGTVRYHEGVKGEGLRSRDIIVWLPPGYEEDLNRRYPVFYMHDGQNIIDPMTSFLRIDWQIDEVADSLIRQGEIEPIIIVGMYNTADRSEEYAPGPKGEAYMKFVVEVVKPLIDTTYRTKPEREHTAVGGSSMGGIISFMLLWEHNDVFSKAACMSPAFQYHTYDYVSTVEQYKGPRKNFLAYIDNGGIELEARLQPGCDAMMEALQKKGYKEGQDYIWYVDKKAEHNEAAWAVRIWRPLKLFFSRS